MGDDLRKRNCDSTLDAVGGAIKAFMTRPKLMDVKKSLMSTFSTQRRRT